MPINVALIGLSASAKTSWAESSHLAYLLSPFGLKHYKIVALLNSSLPAAEAARSHYDLPPFVKVYEDPVALAEDEDVDLVVCNTRVDLHFRTIAPSVKAGKAVYVEWPLTSSLSSSEELLRLAPNQHVLKKSIVGLQGRVSPITLRAKHILSSDTIGTVLSSTVQFYGNLLGRDSFPTSLSYFAERSIGGHQLSIAYAHTIDYIHAVLGEWKHGEFNSVQAIHRPTKSLVNPETGEKVGEIESEVPDFVSVHGTLSPPPSSPGKPTVKVAKNATLVATFRHGTQFQDTPGFTWSIHGTKGELLITAPGPYTFSGYDFTGPIDFVLHDFETDEVRKLGWDWDAWQAELPLKARSVGEVYERYAEWVECGMPREVKEGREWVDLEAGVERMREMEKLYEQFDDGE